MQDAGRRGAYDPPSLRLARALRPKALSSLLLPAPRAGLDGNEYLALMGALGVLVGLALASSGASAA